MYTIRTQSARRAAPRPVPPRHAARSRAVGCVQLLARAHEVDLRVGARRRGGGGGARLQVQRGVVERRGGGGLLLQREARGHAAAARHHYRRRVRFRC